MKCYFCFISKVGTIGGFWKYWRLSQLFTTKLSQFPETSFYAAFRYQSLIDDVDLINLAACTSRMLNKVVNFILKLSNAFSFSHVFSLNSTLSCIIILLQNNFFSYKITKWHFWVIDKENSYWHFNFSYFLVYNYFFYNEIQTISYFLIIVLSLILFSYIFQESLLQQPPLRE